MHKSARILAVVMSCGALWLGGTRTVAEDVGFFPQTTYKIVQLTGDTDHPRRIPTLSRMTSNYCVAGTDLGSTFEHNGKLHFLFGDTPGLPGGTGSDDFLAWTDASRPEGIVLNVFKNGACFSPITIPTVQLNALEVPSYGISVNGLIYLLATTDAAFNAPDPDTMGRSVMAVSSDAGRNFQKLYDLSILSQGGKFINVSMLEVDGRNFTTLPPEPCVLIWGSGSYRQSDVFLAFVPSAQIGNKSAIRYLSGVNGSVPSWSWVETYAESLFNPSQPQVGELSVQYCEQLGKWIMLYNSGDYGNLHGGIHMRSASLPWGPWSQPTVIFNAWDDNAYGRYMHFPGQDVFSDSPVVGPDKAGGPYGPYLIPRFFRGDQNRVTIVYTMSTWNPYQAILMQSDIGYPDRVPPEIITTSVTLPGDTGNGWIVSGNFLKTFTRNGVPYVSSYANNGDADMGVAQYGFVAGCSDQALEFNVHGGDAEVVLIEQTQSIPTAIPNVPDFYQALKAGGYGPVVECMVGPQTNFDNAPDLKVRWDLRRHRSKAMRLFLIDSLNRPWGFISVSQVTHYFVNGTEPVNIYVDGHNDNFFWPFLGTPGYPFATVTAGYNAATDSACVAGILKIRAGNYPENLTMNKSVTLNAEGGAATIGH
jgi:Domain of unknown function (DUF4185)